MKAFIGLIVGALMAALLAFESQAADIAICGASEGYGYYPKIGLGASDASAGEWAVDRISNGRFTVTLSDDNEFDIIVLDATGGMFSSRAAGAVIQVIGKTDETLSLVAIYPGKSIETYTFIRNVDGEAEVMWTANKYGTLIPKAASYKAACSFLAF